MAVLLTGWLVTRKDRKGTRRRLNTRMPGTSMQMAVGAVIHSLYDSV